MEDEVSTIFALREFFAHSGYDVDCAANLLDAVSLIDARPYDAVITDLHLTPRRAGEGLKVAWHARRSYPDACIVLLTAYGSDATEEDAVRCGVDVYQTKPINLPDLSALLDRARRGDRNLGALDLRWRH